MMRSEIKTRSRFSRCGDIAVHGAVQHIINRYESLADQAQKDGNMALEQTYLQHAEHWIKERDGVYEN